MRIKFKYSTFIITIMTLFLTSMLYAQVAEDINTFYNSPTGSYQELSASDIYFVPKEGIDNSEPCAGNGHIYKSDGGGTNEDGPQLYLCKNGTWSILGESDWDQELDLTQPNYMAVYLRNDGLDEDGNPIRVGIGTDPDKDLLLKLNLGYGVTNGLGHDGSIVASGKFGEGEDLPPTLGPGTRMIWYPKKAAFRAGILDSSHSHYWDSDNIGDYSVAFGKNTKATARAAFAVGELSEATGLMKSIAMGYNAKSRARGSFAVGNNVIAQAQGETAFGECNYQFAHSNDSWNATDVAFSLGNGSYNGTDSCDTRTNAITTLKTGMTRIDAGSGAFVPPPLNSAGDYVQAALHINADKLITEHTSAELVFITKKGGDDEFAFDSYSDHFNILRDINGYPEVGTEAEVVLHAIRDDIDGGAVGIMTTNVTEGYNLDVNGDILVTGKIEVEGYMKTNPVSAGVSPGACSNSGYIGFNNDDNHFYVCNGTVWKKILYDGETAPPPPPPPSGCFLAGTPVRMADGTTKPIEEINAGDMVVSFDEKNKVLAEDKVVRFIEVQQDGYFIINGRINVTAKHPFYVKGKWVKAEDLKEGDMLLTKDMKEEAVTSIGKKEETVNVYNIEVDRNNTFIASGIVVHNKTTSPGFSL